MAGVTYFTKKQNLKCIYCGEDQQALAIDCIPFVPNLLGLAPAKYQTNNVHDEKCVECDQTFYLCLNEKNQIMAANLPSKLYAELEKIKQEA